MSDNFKFIISSSILAFGIYHTAILFLKKEEFIIYGRNKFSEKELLKANIDIKDYLVYKKQYINTLNEIKSLNLEKNILDDLIQNPLFCISNCLSEYNNAVYCRNYGKIPCTEFESESYRFTLFPNIQRTLGPHFYKIHIGHDDDKCDKAHSIEEICNDLYEKLISQI